MLETVAHPPQSSSSNCLQHDPFYTFPTVQTSLATWETCTLPSVSSHFLFTEWALPFHRSGASKMWSIQVPGPVLPNRDTQNSVSVPLNTWLVAKELMVAKAFWKRHTLALLEGECDLHFCSTLRFQKPLINASSSKFYF